MKTPAPLQPGGTVGVTSPSSGVPTELRGRLDVAVALIEDRGYRVRVGACMDGSGVVSASAPERAAELMAMLLDPDVQVVIPPWGGELAVEIVPLLDFDALAKAEPTWVVGYSDISTLLVPLTTRLSWRTVHGQNLMDTPYRVPAPLASWLDVVAMEQPATLAQGASTRHRRAGFDDWAANPSVNEFAMDTDGGWRPLDDRTQQVEVSGVLIGGCVETTSILAGTPYGDVRGFADEHAPDGLLVYVEASGDGAVDIARDLWRMRLAGWFDRANAILVGRTNAPDSPGFTQVEAVTSAVGNLGLPVLLDVDCGHVPPHLALVNGAHATVSWTPDDATITQSF